MSLALQEDAGCANNARGDEIVNCDAEPVLAVRDASIDDGRAPSRETNEVRLRAPRVSGGARGDTKFDRDSGPLVNEDSNDE